MATKEGEISFKDKQSSFVNANNHDNQYSNLNLNGNYTCLSTSSVQSHSKPTTLKKGFDSYDVDNNEGKESFSTQMKSASSYGLAEKQVQEMFEKHKEKCQKDFSEKHSSSNVNNSTLSLHIAAYENSAEAPSANKCNEEKKDSKEKEAKQIITDSTLIVQNPFEFPRQQKEDQKTDPEVMQFESSQKLLNPNQKKEASTPKVTPILPSRQNTYDSSFDATIASMKDGENNSGLDASMDVVEDSLLEDKENDGEISRERSLLGTPITKTRLQPNLYTPQTRKDREIRTQRKHSTLSDVSSDEASKMDEDVIEDSFEESKEDGGKSNLKQRLVGKPVKPSRIVIESSDEDSIHDTSTMELQNKRKSSPVLNILSSDDEESPAEFQDKRKPSDVVDINSSDSSIELQNKRKPSDVVNIESSEDDYSVELQNKRKSSDVVNIESSEDDYSVEFQNKRKPSDVVNIESSDSSIEIQNKIKPSPGFDINYSEDDSVMDDDSFKKSVIKKTKKTGETDREGKVEKRLYGGKMTEKRKENIAAVTEEVIQQIHGSLDTMPENVVTETPEDLTIDLMLHQKHGLTWMKWRENNKSPRGGILADDMGLGKTLSMISLIVSQKNDRKKSVEVKEKLAAAMEKQFSHEQNVRPAYCTLVVAPASVIYQWEKEIKDRVKPGKLKVYVFHGPRRERDPQILARNDIVITTYSIISSELGEDKDLIGGDSEEDDGVGDDKWYSKGKASSKKKISKRNTKSVLTQIGWERIVLDEAHNIKNRNSLMSKGCCRLLAHRRWALTGTPIHNELWDFYSLVKFLRISPFSDASYWKENMSDMSGKIAPERLNTLVKSILLRRTKNQICSVTNKPLVDLKPRKFEVVEIKLEGVEEKCYQHMMEASRQKAKELINQQDNTRRRRKGTNVIKNPFVVGNREVDLDDKFQMMSCLLVLLLRLRQACVHMALTKQAIDLDAFKDDGGEGADDVMEELEKTFGNISLGAEEMIAQENKAIDKIFEPEHASGKLKVLLEKIDQVIESGDKCVVVSQWTSMLDIVEQHLKKKKLKLTAINGRILTKDRQERINSFNQTKGGAQVMLLSLTAGGVGLNLVGGNHLFLLDLHWNPALENQACDRIYRVGQTKDVFIHKLICKDTIEQRVLQLQEQKTQLATSVLEGAAKKHSKLTVNDLKFLFGLTKEQQQPKPKEPYQGPNNVRMRE